MNNYAILFADIAGSSALYKRVGDELALKMVDDCLAGISEMVVQFQGTVVKTIGDEVMCFFEDPENAVRCARSVQRDLHQKAKTDSSTLSVKVGIHYGQAMLKDGDIFGDAVNTAARMNPVANAEQIITTQETIDALSEELKSHTRPFDTIKIKGFTQDSVLYIVEWADEEFGDATVLSTGCAANPKAGLASIYLKWGDYRTQIHSDRSSFVIGRDPAQCDLSVTSKRASRKHVWIEFRRGKFVLIDHSTNGTWIQTQDGKQVYLRREELPLWGSGLISLGQPIDNNQEDCIRFVTED
ncbi:adenylate/guanylate cyclase domain-containing protein [Pseudomaricurvus alkylphenolicus]|jgi:hypothetical protein|uniref:adenylate/guanylate cyclase domain-containing protein n=1 Tax=Pseudomaricurvus alkylphenolicus TaxID=1306991 RepID=UPI00141E48C1|nr:adenylate/guanylate cyclase domain-containing protein [Pseudomaricurvus alkylphenolicus]NIB43917.1 adenylate/guanylate cyclase domain-containing protein [Pseudomaricurvus alkylphenolicus]